MTLSASSSTQERKVSTVRPRSLHVIEAAKYLGVTVSFLRSLYWSKQLRGVILGKRLVFDVKDLDSYFDRQKAFAK